MSGTQTNPYIRADVGSLASFLVTELGITVSAATVQQALENYINQFGSNPLPLAQMLPDFESNKAEMLFLLSQSKSWNTLYAAGIGQTVSEMVATAETLNQMAIEKGVQETALITAVLPSSIYAITDMQGVRIPRKVPGSLSASLSLEATQSITVTVPAYSQWLVNGNNYFNNTEIVFPPNTRVINTTLYEGVVSNINFTATGSLYQIYEFGNSDFAISDVDVIVSVNNVEYTSTRVNSYLSLGMWEYGPTDLIFRDKTNSQGNVEISFGDNNYGAAPTAGASINVTFATTSGASGNLQLQGQTISCPSNNLITGTATSNTQNGADEISAQTFKYLTPASMMANYRGITPDDYKSLALNYPGVIDALFLGQTDFAPNNLEYMMNVQVFLITNQPWTTTQWNTFISWMQKLIGANIVLLQQAVTPIYLDINVDIYCFPQTDLDSIQNLIISTLNTNLTVKAGALGYPIYISDLNNFIRSAAKSSIDYIVINSPTTGLTPTAAQYIVLNSTTINMHYTTRGVS